MLLAILAFNVIHPGSVLVGPESGDARVLFYVYGLVPEAETIPKVSKTRRVGGRGDVESTTVTVS